MYSELKKSLDDQAVKLVAVSKTKPKSAIIELYNKGQRIFGENRVQELVEKQQSLPKDISWHLIGALQKNKVKYLASFISLIHSVDSFPLAEKIAKEAAKHDRYIDILLQLKIGAEDSKTGYDPMILWEEINELKALKNIRICGVMGIGTFTDDETITLEEFRALKSFFDKMKAHFFEEDSHFKEISMGMSGDYKLAVKEGSTIVRIGSLLFGSR